jgi:HK97 family phage prohead protease
MEYNDTFRSDFSADELREFAKSGVALPDGSYPIPNQAYLEKAIHAVGRGSNNSHDAIRKHIITRAHALGLASAIPEDWNDDGSLKPGRSEEPEPFVAANGSFTRFVELDDISIRAGGSGRTVVAYMAAFNAPAEIRDQDGHYIETLDPTAFNKTLKERSGQIQVLYNHGRTVLGTPSDKFSMPLGVPVRMVADGRGVLTETEYAKTDTADEVLELIKAGAIRGQSFSGKFTKSERARGRHGDLDTIHRSEVSLREYGPTPMPAYKEAAIVGVRAEEMFEATKGMTEEERTKFFVFLSNQLDTGRSLDQPSQSDEAGAPAATTSADNADAGALEATTVADVVRVDGPSPSERRLRLLKLKELK